MPDALLESQSDSFAYSDEVDDEFDTNQKDLKVALKPKSSEPLISIEEARAKIGERVLAVLDEKFKGNLTEVRHLDDADLVD